MISEGLNQNVGGYIAFLLKSLAGIALVGAFAMSLVQAGKATCIRNIYFRYRLRSFLYGLNRTNVAEIEALIIRYSAGEKDAFYTQSLDGIVQSMGAIKNIGMAWPEGEEIQPFLRLFDPDKVDELLEKRAVEDPDKKIKSEEQQLSAYLGLLISAHIDGFNTRVSTRWTMWQQLAAIVLSVALIFIFAPIENDIYKFVYGLLGGFIAPFIHDLIKKLKPLI